MQIMKKTKSFAKFFISLGPFSQLCFQIIQNDTKSIFFKILCWRNTFISTFIIIIITRISPSLPSFKFCSPLFPKACNDEDPEAPKPSTGPLDTFCLDLELQKKWVILNVFASTLFYFFSFSSFHFLLSAPYKYWRSKSLSLEFIKILDRQSHRQTHYSNTKRKKLTQIKQ